MKYILIIDLASSAEYLIDRIAEEGFTVINLVTQNSSLTSNYCKINSKNCITLLSKQNLYEDVNQLAPYLDKMVTGFYGFELSVMYADKIFNEIFPDTSNDPNTSKLRFDKFSMIKRLNKFRPKLSQISVSLNNPSECIRTAKEWLEREKDIIIKPSSLSAASLGVYSPSSVDDIHRYFVNQRNFIGQSVDYVIQQKINMKIEYLVDCASFNNEHLVVAGGSYCKHLIKGCFEYQHIDYCHANDLPQDVKDFALLVLDKLGMENGLSHIEIARDHSGCLYLIELNPRISGAHGMANAMAKHDTGLDQVNAFLHLMKRVKRKPVYKNSLTSQGFKQRLVFLPRRILKHELSQLQSAYKHSMLEPSLEQDSDDQYSLLHSCYGFVILCHKSMHVIEADTNRLISGDNICPNLTFPAIEQTILGAA